MPNSATPTSKSKIFARVYERDGNIAIKADNAYLDPATKAAMTAGNLASFTLGRSFSIGAIGWARNDREQFRYVGGVEGKFGNGWSWDIYGQHGETEVPERRLFQQSDHRQFQQRRRCGGESGKQPDRLPLDADQPRQRLRPL
jgi:hypothetical protein